MTHLTQTALTAAQEAHDYAERQAKWAHEVAKAYEDQSTPEAELIRDMKGELWHCWNRAFQALRAAEQAHKYATPTPVFTGTLPPAQVSQIEGDEADRL